MDCPYFEQTQGQLKQAVLGFMNVLGKVLSSQVMQNGRVIVNAPWVVLRLSRFPWEEKLLNYIWLEKTSHSPRWLSHFCLEHSSTSNEQLGHNFSRNVGESCPDGFNAKNFECNSQRSRRRFWLESANLCNVKTKSCSLCFQDELSMFLCRLKTWRFSQNRLCTVESAGVGVDLCNAQAAFVSPPSTSSIFRESRTLSIDLVIIDRLTAIAVDQTEHSERPSVFVQSCWSVYKAMLWFIVCGMMNSSSEH